MGALTGDEERDRFCAVRLHDAMHASLSMKHYVAKQGANEMALKDFATIVLLWQ